MNTLKFFSALLLLGLLSCTEKVIEADLLIVNGLVYDGSDTIPKSTSIAIKNDTIVFVGTKDVDLFKAKKTIDAKDLIVAPGFIDPHTHADRELKDPDLSHNLPFLLQGVTTVVVGNDGDSFFPSSEYRQQYEAHGIGTNALMLVGHGTLRKQVMGTSNREASKDEILKMQALIHKEMEAGAFGMSTGLFYSPGSYATTEEVIALAKTVAEQNGMYDTHLRDESSYTVGLIAAITEAIEIGRQAKLPIHISHIKCLGVDVWHQSDSIIQLIESARKEGIQVTANQYPYDASATGLKAAVVPRWAESGGKDSLFIRYDDKMVRASILEETKKNIVRRGGPEKLLIVKTEDSLYVGKTLLEISKIMGRSPEETVFELLKKSYVRVASFNMNPEDIHNFMQQPWVVTGSDGNTGHPRKYGSFPRKYDTYVRKDSIIDLATFINGSTSKTAELLGIEKRGKLLPGYYADLIIFNPETFQDQADYTDAFQFSKGLIFSILNGKLAVSDGKFTGALNGKVLHKKSTNSLN